jgi:hypothetical protein
VFDLYRLNKQRFPTLGIYLRFSSYWIPIFPMFGLDIYHCIITYVNLLHCIITYVNLFHCIITYVNLFHCIITYVNLFHCIITYVNLFPLWYILHLIILRWKHWHEILVLTRIKCTKKNHKPILTLPLFIRVLVPNQESGQSCIYMYMCFWGISIFLLFLRFFY